MTVGGGNLYTWIHFSPSKVLIFYLEPAYKRLGFSEQDHVFSRLVDASTDLLVGICYHQTQNENLVLYLPQGQAFFTSPIPI